MQKHKFKFFRGDDVSYRLFFRQTNGEPVNLEGIRLDLHAIVEGSTEPQIELSTQNGSTTAQSNLSLTKPKFKAGIWTIS